MHQLDDQPIELYDLQSDSVELSDISHVHHYHAAEFEDFLSTARVPSPHWPMD